MPPLKISPEVRKKILEKLLTSPERKALYEKGKEAIEAIVTHPDVKRAYLAGSFASKKKAPSDIDLLVRHKGVTTGEVAEDFFNKFRPYLADPIVGGGGKEGVGVMEAFPNYSTAELKAAYAPESVMKIDTSLKSFKRERDEGIKRYGKNYKWLRIAGLLGALKAAGVMKDEADQPAD
jgi:predicted nucleotidyltransferase